MPEAIQQHVSERRKSSRRIAVLIPTYSSRQSPSRNREIRVCMGCEPILSPTIRSSPISPAGTKQNTATSSTPSTTKV